MVSLDAHRSRSSGLDFGGWIRRNATRPWVVTVVGLVFAAISQTTGQFAYVIIALALLIIAIVLAGNSYSSGVFWILGFSSVTGLYHRLVIHATGQSPPSDFVRLALELSILFYFLVMVGSRLDKRRQRYRIRKSWLDVVVSVYLLLCTLYVLNLFYVEPLVTIYGWRWVCIPIFMYYIGRAIAGKPGMIDQVNKYMIVLLLLQAGYGAYQALAGYPSFEQAWVQALTAGQSTMAVEASMFIAGKARIPALTEGHTSSGFLIPVLFLWALFIPSSTLSKRWRILRRLALLCGLLFLAFSNERSAIGMAGVGIGLVIFLRTRRRLGIGVFFVSIPLLILMIWSLSKVDPATIPWSEDTIVKRRLLELLNPFRSGTFAGRMTEYWPLYWRQFLDNPLGYGLGSFHATSATRGSEWGRSPHNMYLQVLLETGVMGLITFVAIWIGFFANIYMYSKSRFPIFSKGLVFSAAAAFVAFAAIGMANQPIETFPLALHFWFLMGIVTTHFTTRIQSMQHA